MSLGRYALLVAAILAAGLGLAALCCGQRAAPAQRSAVVFGALLAALNTLLAYYAGLWSRDRSHRAFFVAILGGTLVRLVLMLSAVLLGVLALGLPKVPLVVSLLAFFVVFLVLELTLLHRLTSS